MSDLISRKLAIELLENTIAMTKKEERRKNYCVELIKAMPSAEPVKHEECEYIITKGKAGYHEEYKCSACGDSFYWTQDRYIPSRFNYCRNCGRKVIRFIEKEKEG